MLRKYGITLTDRPSLQNPHKHLCMRALAARAQALLQLGVELSLWLCVCGSQGGVQDDTPQCPGAWPWCPDLVGVVLAGVLTSTGLIRAPGCLHT